LEELKNAGLNDLRLQIYLREDEAFDVGVLEKRFDETAQKLGVRCSERKRKAAIINVQFEYEGMTLSCRARDFKQNGNTRGGSLETINPKMRKTPCLSPYLALYVDYNGKVMPCCNLRSDIPSHAEFIIGDVNVSSLQEIFNNAKIKSLRNTLKSLDTLQQLAPCNECCFLDSDTHFQKDLEAIAKYRSETERLQDENEQQQGKIKRLQGEIKEQQGKIKRQQGEIKEQQGKIKHLQDEIQSQREEIQRRDAEIQNQREALTLLRKKNWIYWQYYRYKLFAKLTFGKKRKHYEKKRDLFHKKVQRIRQIGKGQG
jgi:radical SAM protein with 4Fe4S-binding SPASM domain